MTDYKDKIRQLMIALNKLEGLYYSASKQCGIKENTLIFLYALDDGKMHSQKQICEEWLIPKTTINTIVKECIQNGYIQLIAEEGSKEKIIALTEKGTAFTREIMMDLSLAEQYAFEKTVEDFSSDFVQAMERFAEQLEYAISKYSEKEGV